MFEMRSSNYAKYMISSIPLSIRHWGIYRMSDWLELENSKSQNVITEKIHFKIYDKIGFQYSYPIVDN